MGKVKLLKGSEEFEMFSDYWTFLQEHWKVEDNEQYWENVVAKSEAFYRKYQTSFAKELAVAAVNELERRVKHGA